jgi:hypothetical protein
MIIHLRWNDLIERWIMTDTNNYNVMELPDCVNFNRIFQGAKKGVNNSFDLTAEKQGGDNGGE